MADSSRPNSPRLLHSTSGTLMVPLETVSDYSAIDVNKLPSPEPNPPPLDNSSRFFRSEEMTHAQIYIPREIAEETVSALGRLGVFHFNNLNKTKNAFQLPFTAEIRKFDSMIKTLEFLITEAKGTGLSIPEADAMYKSFSVEEMDRILSELDVRVRKISSSEVSFKKLYAELSEQLHVIDETTKYFLEDHAVEPEIIPSSPLGEEHALLKQSLDVELGQCEASGNLSSATHLSFVAGVIGTDKVGILERLLMRMLRNNLFFSAREINAPFDMEGSEISKSVFLIFINGVEVVERIRTLTNTMGGAIYNVSANAEARSIELNTIQQRITDVAHLLQNTGVSKNMLLAQNSKIFNNWLQTLKNKKAVYATMNMFSSDSNKKSLIAEGWCPTEFLLKVQQALVEAKEAVRAPSSSVLNVVATNKTPPTYIKTTPFTFGFQAIIEAYGIPSYGEINPAIFTIVTFPFLFAVMFGDFGHALMITLLALFIFKSEAVRQGANNSEMLQILYNGRYLLLMLGLFSVYTGFIYNDVFSQMMSVFPTTWTFTNAKTLRNSFTYPIGIDWSWGIAENKLTFINNYKMKMAVIFGITQMSFASILSLFNNIHKKNKINIIGEFIPQFLFMQSIFGYLACLIIYKWCINWDDHKDKLVSNQPPGLLNTMIVMFLEMGKVQVEIYKGQAIVQRILLAIAFICVPWMLCLKPYLLYRDHKRTVGYSTLIERQQSPASETKSTDSNTSNEKHEFELSQVIIHQLIHTIECCLGCISNTASYLRLWALSLAHSQLSEVLWEMPFKVLLNFSNTLWFPFVCGFIIFPLWISATIVVLIGMEGLGAFLHALRLHWVEFDSKFFEGNGYKYDPFTLNCSK